MIKVPGPCTGACFGQDGETIVTTTGSNKQSWNARSGEELFNNPPAAAAKNVSRTFDLRWSGEHDVSGASGPGYSVVGTENGASLCFIPEPFPDYSGATVSPNGKYVAVGYQHGRLRIEPVPIAEPIFLYGHSTAMNNHLHQNSIEYLEFDSSSSLLVSMAAEDESPRLWNLQAERHSRVWNQKPAFYLDDPFELNAIAEGTIHTLRFSPVEAKIVCTYRNSNTVQVLEIAEGFLG